MKTIGILFDYNGVLVDDERLHQMAFTQVLQKYGIYLTDELYSRACLGRTDADGFENLAREFKSQLSGVQVKELVELKSSHYRQLAAGTDIFFPGAEETIRRLAQSCRLGIVTSSGRDDVLAVLTPKSLTRVFDFILAAEDIAYGKPNPGGYIKGIKKLGLPKDRVVAIEDSPNGIRAAKSAGLTCIAVLHTTERDDLCQADVIVERISDVDISTVRHAFGSEIQQQ